MTSRLRSNVASSWGPVDTYQLYTLFLDSKYNRRDNVEYFRRSNERQLAKLVAQLQDQGATHRFPATNTNNETTDNNSHGGFHPGMESCLGASPVSSICPEADNNSNNCSKHQNKQQTHDNSSSVANTLEDGLRTPRIQQSCSNSSILHESGDYQWCLDYGYNRDSNHLSSKVPQSIFSASFDHGDFSYDDLSKNIDANLAEIDMETFRTEDIHSILALPAMYCGDFQSTGHGEECASVSGSLLGGLELSSPAREDNSVVKKKEQCSTSANELAAPGHPLCKSTCSSSPRSTSEDDSAEMSICKDEPLFSPVKEQPLPLGNISVDSLDCSSLEEHDLVLTCQANKNNYTIAFEGSGTQFSDDSDYQEVVGSSEGEGACWQDGQRPGGVGRGRGNSMIQSDFVFTTWSKLKRTKDTGRPKSKNGSGGGGGKSQSLPNLLRQSFLLSERRLQRWPTGASNVGCIPLYDIQTSRSGHSHDSDSSCTPRSLSLVKLFIQNRASASPDGGSLSISSSQSESSSCIQTPPLNRPNCNLHNSDSYSFKTKLYGTDNASHQSGEIDFHKEDIVQRQKNLDSVNEKGTNVSFPYSPVHLNFVVPTLNTASQTREANNNVDPMETVDNNNTLLTANAHDNANNAAKETHSDSEEENSQYFEDSLVDAQAIRPKATHASPIKEEEEPLDSDSSSGDETMKDSKDPFSSDSNTSEEAPTVTKNNSLDSPHRPMKQEFRVTSVDRITNVFPTGKCNTLHANTSATLTHQNKIPVKNLDFGPLNQSQGTQTKRFNSKDSSPMESIYQANNTPGSGSAAEAPGTDSGTDVLNNIRRGCSRESSPTSSGYGSSRQNSVERLRRNPPAFIHNAHSPPSSVVLKRKTNVTITTTRNTGTQIPVHIKDQAIQTSFEEEGGAPWEFTVNEKLSPQRSVDDLHINTSTKAKESTSSSHQSSSRDAEAVAGSAPTEKRSLYVCYPNYSLPDLSFLHNMAECPEAPDVVYLTPTKLKIPKPTSQQRSRAAGGHNRPKSCTDFEALSRKNFNHIKDWDSLSILLPQEFKSLISRLRQVGSPTVEQKDRRSPVSSIDADHALFMKFSLRSHKRDHGSKRGSSSGPFSSSGSTSDTDSSCGQEGRSRKETKHHESAAGGQDDYSKDSPTPPPPPKRSLSLPPQNHGSPSNTGKQPPRSILRKSSDSDQYEEPSCQRNVQKCFSLSSAMPLKTEDPRSKRYSLQEPLLQLLEDIPELLHLQSHPSDTHSGEAKKFSLPKKPLSSSSAPHGHALAKSASASSMQPRPCNSKFAWAAKPQQGEAENALNRGSSEECCHGHYQPVGSHRPCHPCSGIQQERIATSGQERTASSDPTPLGQLQGQLCQLLGSDSNLSLVAAALLAAHGSNCSGGQNPSCSSVSSCGSNCQCSCSRGKKSVSFSEKVAVQTRKSPDESHSMLPAPAECSCDVCSSKKRLPANETSDTVDNSMSRSAEEDSESDGPPQEFVVSPPFGVSPVSSPYDDPSHSLLSNPVFTVLAQKRALLERLKEAVHILSSHFKVAKDPEEQEKLGNSCLTPSVGTKVLLHFCPALHTILADGLCSTVTGVFGPQPNSPWKVAEASVQQGDCKKELRELVNHITSSETLGDNHTRFTALILGLLNLGCLHQWIAHLGNCVSLVKQHYQPNALLSMLVSSSTSSVIAEELMAMLQPLSYLPFSLEISLASRKLGHQVQQQAEGFGSLFCPRREPPPVDVNDNATGFGFLRPERKARSCERQRPQSMLEQTPEIDTARRKSWGGVPVLDVLRDELLHGKIDRDWREPEHPLAGMKGGGSEMRNRFGIQDVGSTTKGVRVDGGQHKAIVHPQFANISVAELIPDRQAGEAAEGRRMVRGGRGAGDKGGAEDIANGSFACASSSDSGCSCQTEPLQTSQTQEGGESRPEENHGFEELRQRWEELTSCPNSPRRGHILDAPAAALAKPPLPGRSRTRDAAKAAVGRAASSSLSRIRRPLYSKAEVGPLRRPSTPPSPLRSKTQSPSNLNRQQPPQRLTTDPTEQQQQASHSPVRSGSSAAGGGGSQQPARKSLIPVHRQGARGTSGIPTPTNNCSNKKVPLPKQPNSSGQDGPMRRGISKN